jgi:hypothetical protein
MLDGDVVLMRWDLSLNISRIVKLLSDIVRDKYTSSIDKHFVEPKRYYLTICNDLAHNIKRKTKKKKKYEQRGSHTIYIERIAFVLESLSRNLYMYVSKSSRIAFLNFQNCETNLVQAHLCKYLLIVK